MNPSKKNKCLVRGCSQPRTKFQLCQACYNYLTRDDPDDPLAYHSRAREIGLSEARDKLSEKLGSILFDLDG
jgi:hypothetical protein